MTSDDDERRGEPENWRRRARGGAERGRRRGCAAGAGGNELGLGFGGEWGRLAALYTAGGEGGWNGTDGQIITRCGIQRLKKKAVPKPCQPHFRAVSRASPWADYAAQARARGRVGPGTGTEDAVSGRSWAVFFRVVFVSAHRARPVWKTI